MMDRNSPIPPALSRIRAALSPIRAALSPIRAALHGIKLAAAALAIAVASPAAAKTPTPAQALSLKPIQADANYQQVPAEDVAKCTVVDIETDDMSGWEVNAPDGSLLRRFADTNGDKRIDLWSYFSFGVESYRDIDGDFNGKADQYRWLGNSGTRWGLDRDEDGRIDQWKRISAEEVTAEVIASLTSADARRFANLLARPAELSELGLGKAKLEELRTRVQRAASEFKSLAERQQAVGAGAEWIQFAAPAPGLVPSGTDGSTQDLLVYENVVAMFEDGGKSGQLMVGTLVQVDDAWRMIGLPNVSSDGDTLSQTAGVFFSAGAAVTSQDPVASNVGLQSVVAQLESIDQKLATASEKEAADLHAARADLVEKLIAGSTDPQDRETWTRQLVDTVSVAVQSSSYPDGLKRLKQIAAKFARRNPALAAYANYQAIQSEYVVRQTPDADFEAVQKWYLTVLADFVDDYPDTEEAAQAMLQLALSKEFEEKESEALVFYRKVRDSFESTEVGKKAAGAVRRLESVGRKIELEGNTIGGKAFRLSQLRGRPVVVHYWATWCEPCKQDMKLLSRLQSRYRRAGLTLVGINVDARRSDAEAFLQSNRLGWVQLFGEGGLESSPLANAFGVQTLPTMMLIDKKGVVVRHNVRAAELDEELEEMLK